MVICNLQISKPNLKQRFERVAAAVVLLLGGLIRSLIVIDVKETTGQREILTVTISGEITFMSNGTETINQALKGLAEIGEKEG